MKTFFKDLVTKHLRRGTHGSFSLFSNGKQEVTLFDTISDLVADMNVHDEKAFKAMVLGSDIGLGDSYAEGQWDSKDLTSLLQWFVRNNREITPKRLGWLNTPIKICLNLVRKAQHFGRRNNRENSKKNIHEHYDLGNDFFSEFLDESMTYSSAFFAYEGQSLSDAQEEKYRRMCEKLDLKKSDSLLEIGCGWGGFAIFAAENYGCHVTATTISQEQFIEATRRIESLGLQERIEIVLTDYRDLTGEYDKIASIEMLEAVGHSFLQTYFAAVDRLLFPGGLACVQVITCPSPFYADYLKNADYIQRRIFPGSNLPSNQALLDASTAGGSLEVLHLESFGLHYAETLKRWRLKFEENWPKISKQSFDETFFRKWRFYLCYCEAGFRERHVNVSQLVFARPDEHGYVFEQSHYATPQTESEDQRLAFVR